MRYGFCTGFASLLKDRIDYPLLKDIAAAGYDYVEFPLMLLAALSDEDFEALKRYIPETGLACDACCNMFPPHVKLTGPDEDDEAVREYLRVAIPRMTSLGARMIVLGSAGARNLPEGMTREEGVKQFSRVVRECVVPFLECYDIHLVIEPIGTGEANFVNTLPDGMEIVRAVNHPRVTLLADSVHLFTENEDAADITEFGSWLSHIHMCEAKRGLPVNGMSEGLRAYAEAIKATGYNAAMSFEPLPYPVEDMKASLDVLKAFFG